MKSTCCICGCIMSTVLNKRVLRVCNKSDFPSSPPPTKSQKRQINLCFLKIRFVFANSFLKVKVDLFCFLISIF